MRSVSLVVNRSDRFPVGQSVKAYLAGARHHDGPPAGPAVETQTVAADGSLTFTTLTADVDYVLYALVSGEHRYLNVEESTFTAPAAFVIDRINDFRTANGVS